MSTWQQTQTPYGSGAGLFILILIHFPIELFFNINLIVNINIVDDY